MKVLVHNSRWFIIIVMKAKRKKVLPSIHVYDRPPIEGVHWGCGTTPDVQLWAIAWNYGKLLILHWWRFHHGFHGLESLFNNSFFHFWTCRSDYYPFITSRLCNDLYSINYTPTRTIRIEVSIESFVEDCPQMNFLLVFSIMSILHFSRSK